MTRPAYQKRKKQERKTTHKRVEIQLTQSEYRAFKNAADAEGLSVNNVIKNMATAYRDTTYFVPAPLQSSLREHSRLVRNIANNVNQIAHRSNLFLDVDETQVFKHLAELETQVKDFITEKAR